MELLPELAIESDTKIVFLIADGLGGLPQPGKSEKTEIESANTPNLDRLAQGSICGMSEPIGPGITPGSGPAHLSLFGYDPVKYQIGRGALSAAGVGLEQGQQDVAARINFATIDNNGVVRDRRAGRLPTEKTRDLCSLLEGIKLPGAEIIVRAEKEHRGVVLFKGEGLSDKLTDSDPQKEGLPILEVKATEPHSARTASLINKFIRESISLLKSQPVANAVLLRGFACYPDLPRFDKLYKLKSLALASYPMYKGIARLLGMKVLDGCETIKDEFELLKANFRNHDFFFVHFKKTDSAGEDGDFDRKVKAIEELDGYVPQLMDLKPDVIVVTGDHSTPSVLKSHSWHPVPFLLYSRYCRPDDVSTFSESACRKGLLGVFPAVNIMPLALANGLRLKKFGA